MKYMLDTNVLILLIREMPENICENLFKYTSNEVCVSSITVAELMHGAEKSKKSDENKVMVALALSSFNVVDFNSNAAKEYGIIRSNLEKSGNRIGTMDMLIAGHARSLGVTLVTHNKKDFCRVENLKIEDWQ